MVILNGLQVNRITARLPSFWGASSVAKRATEEAGRRDLSGDQANNDGARPASLGKAGRTPVLPGEAPKAKNAALRFA